MSEKKRIAILGGGYGGVLTAKKLAKKFKKDEEVEITLIDQNPYHTLLTELHEVAAGRVSEDAIRIDYKKIFAKRKVKVVLDEITDLDFKNNVLKSKDNTYEYDYLVIGAGCKPTYFGIKGADMTELALSKAKIGNGICVTEVEVDSPALEAGLKSGDIILAVNDTLFNSVNTFYNLLSVYEPKDKVKITIQRSVKGTNKNMDIIVMLGKKNG